MRQSAATGLPRLTECTSGLMRTSGLHYMLSPRTADRRHLPYRDHEDPQNTAKDLCCSSPIYLRLRPWSNSTPSAFTYERQRHQDTWIARPWGKIFIDLTSTDSKPRESRKPELR